MDRKIPAVFRRTVSMAQMKAFDTSAELPAAKIRKSFLDFFCEENKHAYIRSSPVFSLLDPTLAFVNAGMNQFKDVFLGVVDSVPSRVANSQKCIRVGGKHNDLLQVGQDGTHHSFFEMLGNWSFGDYFKKEACSMAWNLLTNVYKLPPDRLYVTYFGGDVKLNLSPDIEVREIWREIGVDESHILPFGAKDNFWEMGDTGPCGSCTEIHYDHIPGRKNAGSIVNSGATDLSELWNIVFTQYNRKTDGSLEKLDKHFVDTGMGFERLVSVLQGKTSNYDTDLFLPIFDAIRLHSGHSGYTGQYGGHHMDSAYRVLADHGRMITVALTDGMLPNHHTKIRSIIRRALSVCEEAFRSDVALLKEVTNHVAESLSGAYPEIGRNLSKAQFLIDREVELLKAQKANAMKLWQKIKRTYPNITESDLIESPRLIEGLRYVKEKGNLTNADGILSGENAWVLFDTLGITQEGREKIASVLGLKYDESEFERFHESKKKIDRQVSVEKVTKKITEVLSKEALTKLTEMKLEPVKDSFKHSCSFDTSGGYFFPSQEATIQAIIRDNQVVQTVTGEMVKGREIGLVLDRTQFFCRDTNFESDDGLFLIENKIVFRVNRVAKIKNLAVHLGTFEDFSSTASVSVNNIGVLQVNGEKRLERMRNQTGLVLLKAAVRRAVGTYEEKYSMVTADKMTHQFKTYKESVDLNDVEAMERFVTDIIRHDVAVVRRLLSLPKFYQLEDVTFLPGTNLFDSEVPLVEVNSGYTLIREHSTGTHVLKTSHLKDFVITQFNKASYCVENVEAVTGDKVAIIKETDARFREKWTKLKEEITSLILADSELFQVNPMKNELDQLRLEVFNSKEMSYVAKHKMLKEMKKMEQELNTWTTNALNASAVKELSEHLNSTSEKFVIYAFRTLPFTTHVLEVVAENLQDKPAMVFYQKENNAFAIQCYVPEAFPSGEMTPREWLEGALSNSIPLRAWKKKENFKFNYSVVSVKLSEEKLREAMERARELAREKLTK